MTEAPALAAVALDLGGVLVDVHKERLGPLLGRSQRAVERAFFSGDRHTALNRGELHASSFLQGAASQLDLPVAAVEIAWRAFVVARPGVRELVARITLPVTVWSNTDPVHADALQPTLPAVLFECEAFSFTVGARKPEAAFYVEGLARLGLQAEQVLFIDDLGKNVAAARALGVRAVRADTLRDVEHALKDAGVLHA